MTGLSEHGSEIRARGQPKMRRMRQAALHRLIMAAFLALALPGTHMAGAQSLGTDFSAYKSSANKPINIEADLLVVDDKAKKAVFRGNVLARQGDFTLRTKELEVTYAAEPTEGKKGPGNPGQITRIKATGKVLINTRDKQTATSDWADFDVRKQVVTIGGNVVLSQGENVIRGDRLVIDLTTGKSRFEVASEKGKQRIRGLFLPKQKEQKKK